MYINVRKCTFSGVKDSFALCLSIALHQRILQITEELPASSLRGWTVSQGPRQKQCLGFTSALHQLCMKWLFTQGCRELGCQKTFLWQESLTFWAFGNHICWASVNIPSRAPALEPSWAANTWFNTAQEHMLTFTMALKNFWRSSLILKNWSWLPTVQQTAGETCPAIWRALPLLLYRTNIQVHDTCISHVLQFFQETNGLRVKLRLCTSLVDSKHLILLRITQGLELLQDCLEV